MTDHAKEAIKSLTFTGFYSSGSNHHHMALLEAQVHATLALVEQQRIANLIALFQVSDEDANDFMTMGLSYPEVFAEIREGLGL